eukprot:9086695-Alexandrium_andersonii.AAC.1
MPPVDAQPLALDIAVGVPSEPLADQPKRRRIRRQLPNAPSEADARASADVNSESDGPAGSA